MSKHLNPFTLLIESARVAYSLVQREINLAPPRGKGKCPPYVLMHGFAGFQAFKLGPIRLFDYFNGVHKFLSEEGYRVFAPEIEPFAPSYERAQAWAEVITEICEKTDSPTVNLIAHSQAGIDARLLLAPLSVHVDTPIGTLRGLDLAEKIASLTTISAPHEGVALIDAKSKSLFRNESMLRQLSWMANRLPWIFDFAIENIPNVLESLSRQYMQQYFNPHVWDTQGVPCWTIAGDPGDVEITNLLFRDTYEEFFAIPREAGGGPNDGLVAVDSAHFISHTKFGPKRAKPGGTPRWRTLGTVRADHLSQVGLDTGQTDTTVYNHLACFSGLAQHLDRAYVAKMTLFEDGSWERKLDKKLLGKIDSASDGE